VYENTVKAQNLDSEAVHLHTELVDEEFVDSQHLISVPHIVDDVNQATELISLTSYESFHTSSESFEKIEIPIDLEENTEHQQNSRREMVISDRDQNATVSVAKDLHDDTVANLEEEDFKRNNTPSSLKSKEFSPADPSETNGGKVSKERDLSSQIEKRMSLAEIRIPRESDFNVSKLIHEAETRALTQSSSLKDDAIESDAKTSFSITKDQVQLKAPAPALLSEKQPTPPSRLTLDLKRKKSTKSTKSGKEKNKKCTIL
jgi:hypothetical protein